MDRDDRKVRELERRNKQKPDTGPGSRPMCSAEQHQGREAGQVKLEPEGSIVAEVFHRELHRRTPAWHEALVERPFRLRLRRGTPLAPGADGGSGRGCSPTIRVSACQQTRVTRCPVTSRDAARAARPSRSGATWDAQLRFRDRLDKLGVTGSSPVPPTSRKPRLGGVF